MALIDLEPRRLLDVILRYFTEFGNFGPITWLKLGLDLWLRLGLDLYFCDKKCELSSENLQGRIYDGDIRRNYGERVH